MKKLTIILIVGIILSGLVIAQVGVSFPSIFSMSLNALPKQQSPTQLFFNCPYDENIEHRITKINELTFNNTIPVVKAEVQYWTQDRKCAGSKSLTLNLLPSLSSGALVNNFINAVNQAFTQEALSNRQPRTNRSSISIGQ